MVRKRDQFWEHAEQVDGKLKCKYCDRIIAAGVSRLKSHLSGIKGRGIEICTNVPENVRADAAEAISGPNKRAKAEASSGKTEESSPKMLISKHSGLNCSHVEIVKKSWDKTGCTLMSDIWCDEKGSFINIFAHSIEGIVLLNALEIPKEELGSGLLWEIVYFVTEKVGANNVLQYITHCPEEEDELGAEVADRIRSSEFWIEGKEVLHALKSIFQVLRLVDSYGATSGFLYAAVEMADDAIRQLYETNECKYQMLRKNFKDWQENIHHPIHAAAAFLNPAYMCSEKFIENQAMKKGMDFILENLVSDEEKENFVDEMLLYRKKVPELFTCTAMTMLRRYHPCEHLSFNQLTALI
ncbi:hypothetical protein EUGRSUZ_E02336 [Eucalyptus grandis]|uniref:Uncharacterized protein n=1 Tax=Eucalyptus grandis TaxID=71139 RepID=A0ACC3KWH4_EUCGR|nr:hypothetical protein EUGRSUZ_E02336 [Eucalyptus grandis]